MPRIILTFFFVFAFTIVGGQIKLPTFVNDGMVLQRGARIPIWGWAGAGEQIRVQIGGNTYNTIADAAGKWQLRLPPMKAGGPHLMKITGKNEILIKDILIGDVWICSGQSNMQLPMNYVRKIYEPEIATSANPNIRFFFVDRRPSASKQERLDKGKWEKASPKSILTYTAAGYFFARSLFDKFQVPIGIIQACWGGTPIQAWMGEKVNPLSDVQALPGVSPQSQPSALFNGMIAPLVPYAVKGFLWYQGESNTEQPKGYSALFQSLIKDWRWQWGRQIPFLYVQLANYGALKESPAESNWAELREAQREALQLPKTGMVVAHDLGDWKNIHPLNKKDIGLRLMRLAERVVYGNKEVAYSGPEYSQMSIHEGYIVLKFKHVAKGLVSKGSDTLKHFAISGADGKFVWASAAIIAKDKIKVWSPEVGIPKAVRYAWADSPEGCNLYNSAGLPASSFRTSP